MTSNEKNSFSNIDIYAIKFELKKLLLGGYIENIYQLDTDTFTFKIHTKEENIELIYENGKRLHITKYKLEKPREPPAFCKMLRTFLRNAKIEDIEQKDLERIVEFKLISSKGKFKLIFELFSFGNLILVDEYGKIRLALIQKKMKDRAIKIGEEYKLPPSRGVDFLKFNQKSKIKEYLEKQEHKELYKLLLELGLGPEFIKELEYRCKIKLRILSRDLNEEEIKCIIEEIEKIREILLNKKFIGVVYLDNETPIHFSPFELKMFEGKPKKIFNTFNEAVDYFFYHKTITKTVTTLEKALTEKINKIEKIISSQKKLLSEYNKQKEHYRLLGDLFYKYLSLLESLQQTIFQGLKKGLEREEIAGKVNDYLSSKKIPIRVIRFDKKRPIVFLDIEGNEIPLNLKEKISSIANEYYSRAKKMEKKIVNIQEIIEKYQKELNILIKERREKIESEIKKKVTIRKKKKWFQKFRWFISSDGFLVLGGRDSRTNEILVKRYMKKTDIFMHADIHGAPVVLIKRSENENVSEKTLLEAAKFAASYSRAWREGLGSIDVYWVYAHQVSLAPPSGEYLPKGAFIIKGTRNYIKNVVLELAVGITVDREIIYDQDILTAEIVAGPKEALESNTKALCIIVPGGIQKRKVAEKIKKHFEKKLEEKGIIKININIDDLINVLPPGNSNISKCF